MGCGASVPDLDRNDPYYESKRANDAIDLLLARPVTEKDQVKLLLLGAGESGKSTVLKQMRLLHQSGFTHQERLQYVQVIWADAIQSMKILIIQARKMGIELDCDQPDSPLNEFKRNILKYNALRDINTGIAGGSDFLHDYVVKYSRKSEIKRREMSTGQLALAPWELTQTPPQDENALEETMEGLNETGEIGPGVSSLRVSPSKKVAVTKNDIAESIRQLWSHDNGIQICFARSNEFQLEGSASYYFENIFKFAQPSYTCSDEDILKGRIKTTGISETTFAVGGSRFKVLDAGGQRSERSKWIHCFEGITLVLFVMAISEYDQMLFEDKSVNRMHEAIHLFNQLCNSRWFYNTPFILFINKMDIFEKKILKSPIKKYFPQYQGPNGDVKEATKFFETSFQNLNRTPKPIYVHRTCATDTQSMRFVLTAVTDMVIQQNLMKSGMI